MLTPETDTDCGNGVIILHTIIISCGCQESKHIGKKRKGKGLSELV